MNLLRRLALPALLLLSGCHSAEAPEEGMQLAPVVAATLESVEFGEWTELTGATQPLPGQIARIGAVVPGQVVRVLGDGSGTPLREGQRVDKGQVVVQLDDRVARAQRDKTVAMLAEVKQLKVQADLGQKIAKLDLDRLQKLYPITTDPGSIPLVSKIELEKTRLLLQEQESKQKEVQAKEQGIIEDLKTCDVQLGYCSLRSPITGYLGTLQVVPGQTLSAGTAVAEVVNLDAIDVAVFASPHTAAKLAVGQHAKTMGGDQPESSANSLEGEIVYLARQAQPDTGNVMILARFLNKNQRRLANQVVRLHIEVQKKKARLVIADAALMEDQDPPSVVIVQNVETKKNKEGQEEKTGQARRVLAFIGAREPERHLVEILRLEDPEKKEAIPLAETLFILEGGHGLHDGDPVKVDDAKHP